MRIFIIHHHLHPGGVTAVIKSQVEALELNGYHNIEVLTGDNTHAPDTIANQATLVEMPLINYLTEGVENLHTLYEAILLQFRERFSKNDILHFHNLNLGKNPVFSLVVYQLASEGYRVFNHVHDFAEDRPANMQAMKRIVEEEFQKSYRDIMYPDFPHYAFGVLTVHDKERIMHNGINSVRISLLPNPVSPPADVIEAEKSRFRTNVYAQLNLPEQKRLVVYPVRGITRKNLGEFILLAVLLSEKYTFAITQPPKNPKEIPQYENWKAFSQQHQIPVVFEAGQKVDFYELMHTADLCLTTSTMEGFGMVYLEPWLFDTPVAGRDLQTVTRDFYEAGLRLDALYQNLWVQKDGVKIDFSTLPDTEKRDIIEGISKNNNDLKGILQLNFRFVESLNKMDEKIVNHNKNMINNNYSLKKYGEKLHVAYSTIT